MQTNLSRRAKLTLNRIVLSGFGIIVGMVLLLGAVSYHGVYRMHVLQERNQQSFATMRALQTVQDSMTDTDEEIRAHFAGNGWRSHAGEKAVAIFKIEDERLNIDIIAPGVTEWDVQFFQGPFPLERGEKYIATFDARSAIPRGMQVVVENSVNYNRYVVHSLHLSDSWQTYTIEFVMPNDTDVLSQLSFQIGNLPVRTPVERHQVEFDRIGLIEASTGRQLIKNGDFVQTDVDRILPEAYARIREALSEATALTDGHFGQQLLLELLAERMETWRRNNEVLIRTLFADLQLSGRLGVGIELQQREGNVVLAAEIADIIERVETIERQKQAEREAQAGQYRRAVYGALGGTLLLIVIVFIGLYRYVNRSIVRPIVRTTDMLRDMADGDTPAGKTAKQLERDMDTASAEVRTLHRHIADYVRILHNQILIDGLTGLFNRKGFDRRVEELLGEGKHFALVLLDIDRFKRINDTYGHLAGDEVLRGLASVMTGEAAADGFCFRYGGEEFGLLLPGYDAARAYEAAERIRESFAAAQSSGIAATLSAGLAVSVPGDTAETLIERADHALYTAKSSGRNRTTAAEQAQ